jgi:hypothetical protein
MISPSETEPLVTAAEVADELRDGRSSRRISASGASTAAQPQGESCIILTRQPQGVHGAEIAESAISVFGIRRRVIGVSTRPRRRRLALKTD